MPLSLNYLKPLVSKTFYGAKANLALVFLFFTCFSFSQQNIDSDGDGILDEEECGFVFCAEPIVNESFEAPIITSDWTILNETAVPGWNTTAPDNQIEIWRDGAFGHSPSEGNQFAELNANVPSTLYQQLCLTPGTMVRWTVWHKGRSGVDVAEVRIGADITSATVQATMSDGNSTWGEYTDTYTVPDGQTETVFAFVAVSAAGGASVGNFIDNISIEVLNAPSCTNTDGQDGSNNNDLDSDGDGCFDVVEAGFGHLDTNSDGVIDNLTGFTYPDPLDRNENGIKDYLEFIDVAITTNAQDIRIRENTNAVFSFRANNTNEKDITILWQESTDGLNWTDLSDGGMYSGTTTKNLTIANVPLSYDGYLYRALVTNVTNICNAALNTQARLIVRPPLQPISLPDGFSPNNDGINDVLLFANLDTYLDHKLEIYNRYGALVYKGMNGDAPWNGKDRSGKKLPVGVYFYVIITNEPDVEPIQGRVHLRK